MLLAMRKYPVGLPRRDEMIAAALGGEYTGAQLVALIARLDSAGASLLRVVARAGPLAKVERPGAPARVLLARVPPAAQRS